MTTSHLLTKLHHPHFRSNLVRRPRLIKQLNDGLHRGRKMTLVAAPAGFGKTTLLSEWLEELDRPFAWLCLDDGDNDPVRFLSLIIAAVQTIDTRVGIATESYLQSVKLGMTQHGEVQNSEEHWIRSAVTALINEIISLDVPVVLILDDYHEITNNLVHDILQYLVENMPALLHLVLVTREDPPCPLSRMRVRSELTEVRVKDLRFNVNETTSFLAETMGLKLSESAAAALNDRTEGWVAGIQMAALSLASLEKEQAEKWIEDFSGSHHYVIDYFAEEVFQRQPYELKEFLCQTAILDSMCASLCDSVTKETGSQSILDQLSRGNLFLIGLDENRNWYRYHHLFRDFLRTRLEPERQLELHHQAALWYEKRGVFEQAVKHFLAADDLIEVERVVGLACRQVIEKGHLNMLVGWLDALPVERIQQNPELACYKGWALGLMGQRELAEMFAEWAEKSIKADTPQIQIGELQTLKAYLAVQRGDNFSAQELASAALSMMDRANPDFKMSFYSAALLSLGHAQREVGDTLAAIDSFHQVVFDARADGDQLSTMGALEELALIMNQHGRRKEAAALCQKAIDQCKDLNGNPLPISGMAYLVMALLDFEADDLVSTYNHVQKGLELCQPLMMPMITLRGRLLIARLQHKVGHYKLATETIENARMTAGRLEYPRFSKLVETTASNIYVLQGEIDLAVKWAEKVKLSPTDEPDPGREEEYLVYARLLLAQERWEEADCLLEKLASAAQNQGRYGRLINLLAFQAAAKQFLGNVEHARDLLKNALILASPRGYIQGFLEAGSLISDLLPSLQSEAPDLVKMLRSKISGEFSYPLDLDFSLIEPLTSREAEVLRLVIKGLSNREVAEILVVTEWTVKKHLTSVYSKLGVNNRTQAIARAMELSLLD